MAVLKNRAANVPVPVDPTLKLDKASIAKGLQAYEDWHWGIGAHRVMDWDDPDYPNMLVECGRLIRMHVRTPDAVRKKVEHPRRRRDSMIEFSKSISRKSHIAYDPSHPNERLYLLVDPQAAQTLARRFWFENDVAPIPLPELAIIAGGRHGATDYPNVPVKVIGIFTAVVYFTHKKGDENPDEPRSYYIHQLGELSHHYPILCCDERGRLWIAGGNYRTPTPGITD